MYKFNMNIWITTLFVLITFSGCAALPQSIPLTPDNKVTIQLKDITITRQMTGGFIFNTPAGALVDGGLARWRNPDKALTWNKLVEWYKIPDFNEAIQELLMKELTATYGPRAPRVSTRVEPWDEDANYKRLLENYDTKYVLELRKKMGFFMYGLVSWQTYHMTYLGDMVLVRLEDLKPIWKVSCVVKPEDSDKLVVPGKDFLSEEGTLFKAAAQQVTQMCAAQYVKAFRETFQ